MDRDLLGHLPILVCVARHRSFAAAAADLGISPSAVSHAVRSVEDRVAIPLFSRTTRSVSLTEAGTRFIAGVEPALTDIEKTVEGLRAERGEVTGLLRIDAPRLVLDMALTGILAKLARKHPRLTVEVRTGQASVDIVAQGFDAGIRIRRAIQQDMITTRLTGPFKAILVASRNYLDARGTPESISDLHQHNCIGIRTVVSGAVLHRLEGARAEADHDLADRFPGGSECWLDPVNRRTRQRAVLCRRRPRARAAAAASSRRSARMSPRRSMWCRGNGSSPSTCGRSSAAGLARRSANRPPPSMRSRAASPGQACWR